MKNLMLFVAIGLIACGTPKKQQAAQEAPKVEINEAPKVETQVGPQEKKKPVVDNKNQTLPSKGDNKAEVKPEDGPQFLMVRVPETADVNAANVDVSMSFSNDANLTDDSSTSAFNDSAISVTEFGAERDSSTSSSNVSISISRSNTYKPWSLVNRVGRQLFGPSPRFFAYLNGQYNYGCSYTYNRSKSFNRYGYSYNAYQQSSCGSVQPSCPPPVYPEYNGQYYPSNNNGQYYPGQGGNIGQGNPGQVFPGQGNPGQVFPGQGNPGQVFPGQGNPGQNQNYPSQNFPNQTFPGQATGNYFPQGTVNPGCSVAPQRY